MNRVDPYEAHLRFTADEKRREAARLVSQAEALEDACIRYSLMRDQGELTPYPSIKEMGSGNG